jgi:hypothetical protein
LASVTFDSKAAAFINGVAGSENVVLDIERVDTSMLAQEIRATVGDRPVYDFNLTAGNVKPLDVPLYARAVIPVVTFTVT